MSRLLEMARVMEIEQKMKTEDFPPENPMNQVFEHGVLYGIQRIIGLIERQECKQ